MIDLRIHTDEPWRQDLIRRYWKHGASGGFEESLDALTDEYRLSRGSILGIVRSGSTAYSEVHYCAECGAQKTFDSRKDLRETPKQQTFLCEDCRPGGSEEAAEGSRSESRAQAPLFAGEDLPDGGPEPPAGAAGASEGESPAAQDVAEKLERVARGLSALARQLHASAE
jgi:hypothetical protein